MHMRYARHNVPHVHPGYPHGMLHVIRMPYESQCRRARNNDFPHDISHRIRIRYHTPYRFLFDTTFRADILRSPFGMRCAYRVTRHVNLRHRKQNLI